MSEPGNEVEPQYEPEEKCLNCGTVLSDRFCGHCGQDKKEFKRSVWLVFFQFFETFTDFDNKLWSSLGPLIYKPGFLTKKFLAGKRKSKQHDFGMKSPLIFGTSGTNMSSAGPSPHGGSACRKHGMAHLCARTRKAFGESIRVLHRISGSRARWCHLRRSHRPAPRESTARA